MKNFDLFDIPLDSNEDISLDVKTESTNTANNDGDIYNTALNALLKSFQEGTEILEMLTKMKPSEDDHSLEERQREYTENAIYDAAIESVASGPYYESATKENKEKIQAIAKSLRAMVKELPVDEKKNPYNLKPLTKLGYLFTRTVDRLRNEGPQRKWMGVSKLNPILWQMCGVFFAHQNEIDDALEFYTNMFKDEIGDFKFNAVRTTLSWSDFFGKKAKGSDGVPYILVLDTKRAHRIDTVDIPSEAEVKEQLKEQ